MANVTFVIDRHAAGIHADFFSARIQRLQRFLAPGQGVGDEDLRRSCGGHLVVLPGKSLG